MTHVNVVHIISFWRQSRAPIQVSLTC